MAIPLLLLDPLVSWKPQYASVFMNFPLDPGMYDLFLSHRLLHAMSTPWSAVPLELPKGVCGQRVIKPFPLPHETVTPGQLSTSVQMCSMHLGSLAGGEIIPHGRIDINLL